MSESIDCWWRFVPELGLLNIGEASDAWSEIGHSRKIRCAPTWLSLIIPERRAMDEKISSPGEWGVVFAKSPLPTLAGRGHRKVNLLRKVIGVNCIVCLHLQKLFDELGMKCAPSWQLWRWLEDVSGVSHAQT